MQTAVIRRLLTLFFEVDDEIFLSVNSSLAGSPKMGTKCPSRFAQEVGAGRCREIGLPSDHRSEGPKGFVFCVLLSHYRSN